MVPLLNGLKQEDLCLPMVDDFIEGLSDFLAIQGVPNILCFKRCVLLAQLHGPHDPHDGGQGVGLYYFLVFRQLTGILFQPAARFRFH